MAFDNMIFEGKTLSDMFSDVYTNTGNKRKQIEQFIGQMVKLIQTPEDAAVLGPVVAKFFDVNVKNDEHIVRLVQIAQRMISATAQNSEGDLLSDAEKEQILKNVKLEFDTIIEEQTIIQNALDGLEE